MVKESGVLRFHPMHQLLQNIYELKIEKIYEKKLLFLDNRFFIRFELNLPLLILLETVLKPNLMTDKLM